VDANGRLDARRGSVASAIFYPLAFLGVWSMGPVGRLMVTNYVLKVATEVVLTPMTYRVIVSLKHTEGEDYHDIGTNFSPLPTG
jgi:uncharacterized PurR-regulated membrane protein YhhQ (DUF165 family)